MVVAKSILIGLAGKDRFFFIYLTEKTNLDPGDISRFVLTVAKWLTADKSSNFSYEEGLSNAY